MKIKRIDFRGDGIRACACAAGIAALIETSVKIIEKEAGIVNI